MKIKKFQNNMRLVVNTKKGVDVVSFKIYVTVGSQNERPSELGFAHFLEHMFFKSTSNHSSTEILKRLDDLGATKNAYTSITKTCYYFKCIGSVLEECVSLYSEMFFNQAFKQEEIENEKMVILEEHKMDEDDPFKKCIQTGYNTMFSGTSIGHSVLGTPKTINSVTSKKLLDFKKRTYLPRRYAWPTYKRRIIFRRYY